MMRNFAFEVQEYKPRGPVAFEKVYRHMEVLFVIRIRDIKCDYDSFSIIKNRLRSFSHQMIRTELKFICKH